MGETERTNPLQRLIEVPELPAEIQKKAEEELNEKPQWRERDIQALKEMIQAHPGLHGCVEPGFLLRYLRARKFDYDRAFALYVNHYRFKMEQPDVFADISPASISHIISAGITAIMPQADATGHRIMIFRPGFWEPENSPNIDLLRTNFVCVEHLLAEATFQIHGLILVVDLYNFGFRHANQFGIRFARMASRFLQDCTPVRVKAIHFVNEPSVFGYAFMIMRPFLTEKIQKRLFFHGSDVSSLHKHVQPELLPANASLGGTGPTIPLEGYMQELMEDTKYFHAMNQFYMDTNNEKILETDEDNLANDDNGALVSMGCSPRGCEISQ